MWERRMKVEKMKKKIVVKEFNNPWSPSVLLISKPSHSFSFLLTKNLSWGPVLRSQHKFHYLLQDMEIVFREETPLFVNR
jgi:hypothetical protein